MKPIHRPARGGAAAKAQEGIILLEGLIAILIFSLGILGVMGLQAVSAKTVTNAKARSEANYIAQQRIGVMWVDQPNLASYAETDTDVPQLPSGKRTTVVNGDQVTITVTWQMPGDPGPNNYQTIARVNTNPAP